MSDPMTHGFILPEDEITAVESIDTIFLAKPEEPDDPAKIPCPPSAMKLYGETDDQHLSGGYDNYRAICQALDRGGMPVQSIRRLVEFGCSNSRILRWFLPHAKEGVEVWGLDIDAKRLLWSDYTFGPHIHYALTSTQPHLPFSGSYFDFLYAGSVFTHIDSNYLSWFSELRRVLRPDGLAWITINDETTVEILVDLKGDYFIDKMKEETEFNTFIKMNWTRLAVGTGVNRNVFYRRSWLVERIAPLFEVIDVEEKIYAGFQTALLLRARDNSSTRSRNDAVSACFTHPCTDYGRDEIGGGHMDLTSLVDSAKELGYRVVEEDKIKLDWDRMQLLEWQNQIVHNTAQYLATMCMNEINSWPSSHFDKWKSGLKDEIIFWWRYVATQGSDYQAQDYVRGFPLEKDFIYDGLFQGRSRATIAILDIGAGIISEVGSRSAKWQIEHKAIDPLAPAYNWILKLYDIMPPNPVYPGHAERLKDIFGDQQFDFIHAKNCLDHMYDPMKALTNMAEALAPGGVMLLRHWRNEAEFEKYSGLHQWNLDWDGEALTVWNREVKERFDHIRYDLSVEARQTEDAGRPFIDIEYRRADI